MNAKLFHNLLTYFTAAIWLINGFFCKVLNFVPRHQMIVGEILGNENAFIFTKIIGFSEIAMAIWIITKFKAKINAISQMFIIALMNILEFILVPDLLLWGKMNIIFAFLFISLIFYNQFILTKKFK
ncbi:DoxX-like family protein [Halpernia humi]|uniref:DoxX-like family protein n=1 Tax=Halpernia humi TaxID=493375 RepID=A0A1H5TVX6_9FLAO|nr:DoxX-like family protein [Halpernia humi]SEF66954.1 DoxX-like family protein [Halpernia humi]